MNPETLRQNTIQSFQHVKQHIAQLEHALIENQAEIAQLKDQLHTLSITLSQHNSTPDKSIPRKKKPRKAAKRTTQKFIAAKTGTTFHKPSCPWTTNMSKKNRRIFTSPTQAKKAGLKPCKTCLR